MLENTWYSVIAPESCSSILWRSWGAQRNCCQCIKTYSTRYAERKIIDGIIEEPLGGAHYDPQIAYNNVKKNI